MQLPVFACERRYGLFYFILVVDYAYLYVINIFMLYYFYHVSYICIT